MTDKEKLEIYNVLREMHRKLTSIMTDHEVVISVAEWERNALVCVSSTLYLAESVFARMSE